MTVRMANFKPRKLLKWDGTATGNVVDVTCGDRVCGGPRSGWCEELCGGPSCGLFQARIYNKDTEGSPLRIYDCRAAERRYLKAHEGEQE